MDSKKDGFENPSDGEGGSAPRARNRTVMLTPEMTGQLRTRMGREGIVSREPEEQHPQAAEIEAQIAEMQAMESDQAQYRLRSPRQLQPTPQAPVRPEFFSLPIEQTHPAADTGIEAPVNHLHGGQEKSEPFPMKSASKDAIYWAKSNPMVGFLVSFDNVENGEAFELRQGRVIVTSERAAHGDYFVIMDETVSPMHAILRITSAGEVQVLDQLSEYGTKIKRLGSDQVEDLSGERSLVGHGDILYFGKRSFHVCMIVRHD